MPRGQTNQQVKKEIPRQYKMSRQIVLRSPTLNKKQPLLQSRSTASSRFGEVAGGTAAECAVVCCCCPCGLANLLLLAICKVPAGLCRKAIKEKRRKQLIKKGLIPQPSKKRSMSKCGCDDHTELEIRPVVAFDNLNSDAESEKKVMELEKEMWARFYSTGFWRSPSQRESVN